MEDIISNDLLQQIDEAKKVPNIIKILCKELKGKPKKEEKFVKQVLNYSFEVSKEDDWKLLIELITIYKKMNKTSGTTVTSDMVEEVLKQKNIELLVNLGATDVTLNNILLQFESGNMIEKEAALLNFEKSIKTSSCNSKVIDLFNIKKKTLIFTFLMLNFYKRNKLFNQLQVLFISNYAESNKTVDKNIVINNLKSEKFAEKLMPYKVVFCDFISEVKILKNSNEQFIEQNSKLSSEVNELKNMINKLLSENEDFKNEINNLNSNISEIEKKHERTRSFLKNEEKKFDSQFIEMKNELIKKINDSIKLDLNGIDEISDELNENDKEMIKLYLNRIKINLSRME